MADHRYEVGSAAVEASPVAERKNILAGSSINKWLDAAICDCQNAQRRTP